MTTMPNEHKVGDDLSVAPDKQSTLSWSKDQKKMHDELRKHVIKKSGLAPGAVDVLFRLLSQDVETAYSRAVGQKVCRGKEGHAEEGE